MSVADKRVWLHDINGGGTWYDLTDYVLEYPSSLHSQASGEITTLDLKVKSSLGGVKLG